MLIDEHKEAGKQSSLIFCTDITEEVKPSHFKLSQDVKHGSTIKHKYKQRMMKW